MILQLLHGGKKYFEKTASLIILDFCREEEITQ